MTGYQCCAIIHDCFQPRAADNAVAAVCRIVTAHFRGLEAQLGPILAAILSNLPLRVDLLEYITVIKCFTQLLTVAPALVC